MEYLKLNNGGLMPPIGIGTWKTSDDEAARAVGEALDIGYRLIDTAKLYKNERGVGEAVRASGVPRQKIFVTTKLLNKDQGYHSARAAFDESLNKLGLDYIDLYLIHWPGSDQRHKSWQALTEIYEDGQAKAIGVSNYEIWHLEEVLQQSPVVPAVNQIPFHPFVYEKQKPIVDFCHQQGIVVEAYSPLAEGDALDNDTIVGIAKAHKKSPAQILLRWAIQHGTIPIPKSTHPKRLAENFKVFDFELSSSETDSLNSLSQ